MTPGELIAEDGELEINEGREVIVLTIANTGDRPIQVGSHYHFYEANSALEFDREKSKGKRLDIPAGTAIRLLRPIVPFGSSVMTGPVTT